MFQLKFVLHVHEWLTYFIFKRKQQKDYITGLILNCVKQPFSIYKVEFNIEVLLYNVLYFETGFSIIMLCNKEIEWVIYIERYLDDHYNSLS